MPESEMEINQVATATQELNRYLESFGDFEKSAAGSNLPWLRKLRANAFARFCEVGFPTSRTEDWRFTSVSAIAQTQFRLAPKTHRLPDAQALRSYGLTQSICRLVFVDGHFASALSSVGNLPKGVRVGGLADELALNAPSLEKHLGHYLDTQRDVFSALNTAFLEDGAFIYIPRGTVVAEPIYLLFVSSDASVPVMSHPRNLIVAEENSHATIVEDYVSFGTEIAFCNTATELVAGDHAVISHYMIEREHTQAFNISTLRLQQGRASNVASHSVLIGGALVRNNVHPVLAGEGAECLINGLFIGNGRQHLDNYMLVEHASPHCSSRQFYNGILDGHAHGVFHGRIIVHKDAQKTDAKQTNRNLLLSDDAQVDTKPQLEIYADDVKCTHGATIGQMDETALFYLRSRGIDESSARRMLLMAFAGECMDRMRAGAARTHVEEIVNAYLSQIVAKSALLSGETAPLKKSREAVG